MRGVRYESVIQRCDGGDVGVILLFAIGVVRVGGCGRGRGGWWEGLGSRWEEKRESGKEGLRCDIWIAEGAAVDVEDCVGGVFVVGSGRGRGGGGEVEVEGAEGQGG